VILVLKLRFSRLPIDASYKLGALCEPLSVAIHANKRASLAPGSKVLVLGAGTIGLCVAAVAKINGASAVLIADINRKRCTFASEHGFAHKSCTIPLRNGNNTEDRIKIAQETASDLTDNLGTDGLRIGEFDAVFECSGASACLQTAIYVSIPIPFKGHKANIS
jgi:L-iditol 2-dehydrogenase